MFSFLPFLRMKNTLEEKVLSFIRKESRKFARKSRLMGNVKKDFILSMNIKKGPHIL